MRFVLDTNSVSFLMKGVPSVVGELSSRSRADVFLPQPVISEIEYGLARLAKSKRLDRLRQRFRIIERELQRVPWSDQVSRAFGEIKADLERRGLRLEDFDVAVAAHALANDAILVTDNLDPMSRVSGLRIENWLGDA